MAKIEKIFLVCVLGAIPPIAGFLGGWWGTFKFFPVNLVITAAGLGLFLGLVIDSLFLKKWVDKAYQMDLRYWMAIYLFYSIGIFGMFMGVPIFNLFLALPACFFMSRRLVNMRAEAGELSRFGKGTRLFATIVLAIICLTSAIIALIDPTTGANLKGMLGVDFEVTKPIIWGIILIGGSVLLILQWWFMKKTMQIFSKTTS